MVIFWSKTRKIRKKTDKSPCLISISVYTSLRTMWEVDIMIIDAFTISAAVIAMAVIISVIAVSCNQHQED